MVQRILQWESVCDLCRACVGLEMSGLCDSSEHEGLMSVPPSCPQALLDVYTIQREIGRLDNFSVGLVGDLANGRTVRSLAYVLSLYSNVKMYFVAPNEVRCERLGVWVCGCVDVKCSHCAYGRLLALAPKVGGVVAPPHVAHGVWGLMIRRFCCCCCRCTCAAAANRVGRRCCWCCLSLQQKVARDFRHPPPCSAACGRTSESI